MDFWVPILILDTHEWSSIEAAARSSAVPPRW